jgi:hypothetical protein
MSSPPRCIDYDHVHAAGSSAGARTVETRHLFPVVPYRQVPAHGVMLAAAGVTGARHGARLLGVPALQILDDGILARLLHQLFSARRLAAINTDAWLLPQGSVRPEPFTCDKLGRGGVVVKRYAACDLGCTHC